ncbi:cation/acetate symporter [Kibdelosporangium banguiense]|uniref:Cation/acetate symporter n=1 Tax=Kibdelosporangium banguiense TaxID=1365924 RepID=A0ABS4TN56_9PSEU|nr:cation acetate symporter [Kibdelosporangium banguiense]MBP2325840.1 cation/acetate symporter [Kibdelosporangium banguiense]
MTVNLAATAGNPGINISVFVGVVAVTLFIVYRVSRRNTTAADYYAAGGSFTGIQNGFALSGDYLSAASFLGIAGAIAVYGYDGFLFSVGFLVAWLVPLLLVAERIRNIGRYTMGDVISFRMRQRPVRAAAANSTLVISFFYMLAQMAGAGGLVALLLDVHTVGGQALVIGVVGLIMIFYVLVGGMRGTTWVQIVKAALLLVCVALMSVFLLGKFGFSLSDLLGKAVSNNAIDSAVLEPGARYGKTDTSKLDFVSLSLALVLGTAALPHVLMRFYTVPNAQQARRSVVWAIWAMVLFYLSTLIIGYGASAMVGSDAIVKAPGGENSAAPLLAFEIGGATLLGIVSAVAFTTILAVVAGLTLTASASFAHDVYANVIKRGNPEPGSEVRVARLTAVVVGCLAVGGGILAIGQNVAFLVSLAFALAASANLPAILYTLFWRRFNTTGTLWSIYGGLSTCLVLITFSPVVSGSPTSIFSGVDFAWFPLSNPGLFSIPLSFALGIVGTIVGEKKGDSDTERRDEMAVRSVTGIGSD